MKRLVIAVAIVALFAGMIGCAEPARYNLTISTTEGGEVATPSEMTSSYDEGTEVPLVALPHAGYRFVNWTGDVDTIANINSASTTITIDGDYSITANFAVKQYDLTISSTEGGSVTAPGEGTFAYAEGTPVNLVAVAREDYKFINWTGDVDTLANVTAASTTVTMAADCTITANYLPADTYLDDIGPGLWTLFVVGQGVEATVTDYGIVVNIASDPVDDPELGEFMAGALCSLEGDFDIRMGYELIVWPEESGVRVGLAAGIGDDVTGAGVIVERVGWAPTEWPQLPFREVYLVHSEQGIHGIAGTSDLSGTLRICRKADIVTGYYETSEGWCEVYSAEWSTEDVGIRPAVWSHEDLFGGEEVSVLLRTVEIVEPVS